ncbi:AlpA family transcriptional regulator [Roseivirga pacifica]|uniref:Transcriptional regulator, AlpA family n=1 Tax=Roseivirga pacifica TaxID=1267423 RepID=A0A1I0QH77_9BACT|nr:AlpA family transcriptional regulator [Roseivirga pacifica]SEW26487.1 transcriptional regulator, AlpA family [Roseivirga pacifica]
MLNQLEELVKRSTINTKNVLTVEEAVEYTGLAKSSLYKLTANKSIPHYKPIGKRIYFRRTELEEWMLKNPIQPLSSIDRRVSDILYELEQTRN